MLHPHVHCVVPGGGFSADRKRWLSVRNEKYLLPVRVLAARFRTLLIAALREAEREGKFERLPREVLPHTTIEGASAQQWVVYVKPPFGGPEQVLEYLSRYTHRVAISNSRIEAFSNDQVTFRWRDYRDGDRTKHMTVTAIEFLRRFLLHILPDRFVRIRYFGFMANRKRAEHVELARQLIGCAKPDRVAAPLPSRVLCPACYALITSRRPRAACASVRPPPVENTA